MLKDMSISPPGFARFIHDISNAQFRSRSEQDLAARRAIWELEGSGEHDLRPYCQENSAQYAAMVECIRYRMGLTSLMYQTLNDLIEAVGLPREKLCTYCWTGEE